MFSTLMMNIIFLSFSLPITCYILFQIIKINKEYLGDIENQTFTSVRGAKNNTFFPFVRCNTDSQQWRKVNTITLFEIYIYIYIYTYSFNNKMKNIQSDYNFNWICSKFFFRWHKEWWLKKYLLLIFLHASHKRPFDLLFECWRAAKTLYFCAPN